MRGSAWRGRSLPLARGIMPINGAALDWQRVDRWTSDIVAGETAAIKAVFTQYGAQPPDLVWNPSAELASAQEIQFLMEYWRRSASDGSLPHVRQVDPVELRRALGYVMLLDVVDG